MRGSEPQLGAGTGLAPCPAPGMGSQRAPGPSRRGSRAAAPLHPGLDFSKAVFYIINCQLYQSSDLCFKDGLAELIPFLHCVVLDDDKLRTASPTEPNDEPLHFILINTDSEYIFISRQERSAGSSSSAFTPRSPARLQRPLHPRAAQHRPGTGHRVSNQPGTGGTSHWALEKANLAAPRAGGAGPADPGSALRDKASLGVPPPSSAGGGAIIRHVCNFSNLEQLSRLPGISDESSPLFPEEVTAFLDLGSIILFD